VIRVGVQACLSYYSRASAPDHRRVNSTRVQRQHLPSLRSPLTCGERLGGCSFTGPAQAPSTVAFCAVALVGKGQSVLKAGEREDALHAGWSA
jgi:hypothetical protein